jgi:hypothetical protein
MAISKAEGLISFSQVQMKAFSRYFMFQILNVFLVTSIAGSIFDTLAIILENPEAAFEMLGNSLPRMSSFFHHFGDDEDVFGVGCRVGKDYEYCAECFEVYFVSHCHVTTEKVGEDWYESY